MTSRPILLAIIALLLASLLPYGYVFGKVTVDGVTVEMDRTTFYVNNSLARAEATLAYHGNAAELGNVRFTWYYPNLTVASLQIDAAKDDANATSSLFLNVTGIWHLNATYVNNTDRFDNVSFEVVKGSDVVVVTDIEVTTNSAFYEIGEAVVATAILTFSGNASLFAPTNYTWIDPLGNVLRQNSSLPNETGTCVDVWTSDALGNGFVVYANYTGDEPVSAVTNFSVVPLRVRTWHNQSVVSDEVWQKSSGPFGICKNITVEAGAKLTIENGTKVRFCRDASLTINGTLISEGLQDDLVVFTAFSFLPSKGDWKGIFFNPSSGNKSRMTHSRVEYATSGIDILSAAPEIRNDIFEWMSLVGISAKESNLSLEFNTMNDTGKGISVFSSSVHLRYNRIQNDTIGVALLESNATFLGDVVRNCSSAGIHAFNSSFDAEGLQLSFNERAIRLQESSQATISSTSWVSNYYGIDSISSDFVVKRGFFSLNDNAIYAIDAEATLTNSTIAASFSSDFILDGGSYIVALNCSLNDSKVQVRSGSKLLVKNFLGILVIEEDETPVENAFIEVYDNSVPSISGRTTSNGMLQWLAVTDRVFNGSNTPTEHSTTVFVSIDGYNVTDNGRTVDMSISHLETFLASRIEVTPPDLFRNTLGPFGLLLIIALIIAAIVVALLVILSRRKKVEEPLEEIPPPPPEEERKVMLRDGVTYLIDEEGPGTAFKLFTDQLSQGTKGIAFTRTIPDEVKHKHSLGDETPLFWLSRGQERNTISPTNLGAILLEVEKFLKSHKGEDTIVLLDGLEYLIVQNDFSKVLKFVQSFRDLVSLQRSKALIPFSMLTLEESRRALLRRELTVIE